MNAKCNCGKILKPGFIRCWRCEAARRDRVESLRWMAEAREIIVNDLELLISQRDAERAARKALQDAADVFAADQRRAPHPACGLVQPVSVDDCEALNAALALAAKLP